MKHTAPTYEAFDAIPDGTVKDLLLPENIDNLIDIIKYHVVGANTRSDTLSSGGVETLNGDDYFHDSLQVVVSDAGVMVNDASVVIPDIIASNGIIHVIDSVLIPPTDEPLNPAEIPEPADSIYDIAANADDFSTRVELNILFLMCMK